MIVFYVHSHDAPHSLSHGIVNACCVSSKGLPLANFVRIRTMPVLTIPVGTDKEGVAIGLLLMGNGTVKV